MITTPGLYYDMQAADYHADPCPAPSLSSSIAKVMIADTPLHAWAKHPRLNLLREPDGDPSRPAEIGTAAHKMLLGRGAEIAIIDAKTYQSSAAKEERATAYANGQAPILKADHLDAVRLADNARRALEQIEGCAGFFAGQSEVVMAWEDMGGVWCRGMIDRLTMDARSAIIWDVKTTAAGLSDRALGARIAEGYDMQATMYVRGLSRLSPALAGRIKFRWIFIEQSEPHEVRVIEADRATLTIGDKKAAFAIELWRRCMAANEWPGYRREIGTLEYPMWSEAQWMRREEADFDIAKASVPMDQPVERPARDNIIYGETRIAVP
jgi:hypothetical protein